MSDQVYEYSSAAEKQRLKDMHYDALNALLLQELSTPEAARNNDYIHLILEEMKGREDAPCTMRGEDVAEALRYFREDFGGKAANGAAAPEAASPSVASEKAPGKKRGIRILNVAAIAAVIILLLCGTASALGFNVFKAFAVWTDSTLFFTNGNSERPSILEQHAFPDLNIVVRSYSTLPLVPDHDLKASSLEKMDWVKTAVGTQVTATYLHDGGTINFRYIFYTDPENTPASEYRMNNNEVILYEHNGTSYYIFMNADQCNIVWTVENVACNIYGDFTMEEAKEMVDSIR